MVLKNTPTAPKLLDLVREKLRLLHYSIRTEDQYVQWIKRFILFHGKRHPREMEGIHVFLFGNSVSMKRVYINQKELSILRSLIVK